MFPASSFALTLYHPCGPNKSSENSCPHAIGVKVGEFFQWEEVEEATKYVLDIAQFTQSEDNLIPSSPKLECKTGTCSFAFFDLSVGKITHGETYVWKVTAYNAAGNPIDDSNIATFSTPQRPEVVQPPNQGGSGSNDRVINPSDLNPISSATLEELFTAVRNFLFGLSIVLLPVVILYGGFLLLTAQGDPEKISRARTVLLWAVVAFAIILVAGGLPNVLRDLL